MQPTTTNPRETLEIIIDTCSLAPDQLQGVEQLIQHALNARPPMYRNYRIVVPVQIATEVKQRIFPDFLAAELSKPRPDGAPAKGFRAFYEKHKDHIEIVETDVSILYKMMYLKKTLAILHAYPENKQAVLKVANELAERYKDDIAATRPFTTEMLEGLCTRAEKSFAEHETSLQQSHTELRQHHRRYGRETVPEDALLQAAFKNAARAGQRFLNSLSNEERYCLQALYSEPTIYRAVAADKEFNAFRKDKGERAIEAYLFDKRAKFDSRVVSVVVSHDKGARDGIRALRHRSHNTLIAVDNKALTNACNLLNGESIPEPLARRRVVPQEPTLAQRGQNGKRSWANNPTNPRKGRMEAGKDRSHKPEQAPSPLMEIDLAQRLCELISQGHWRPRHRQRIGQRRETITGASV